jgi:hypothetical protein
MSKELENIFEERFKTFESQPSAGLFDAIQAKRKKRKVVAWWWMAASILMIGSAVTVWQLNKPNDVQPANTVNEHIENTESMEKPLAQQETIVEDNSATSNTIEPETTETANLRQDFENTPTPLVDHSLSFPTDNSHASSGEPNTSTDRVIDSDLADRFKQILDANKDVNPDKATIHIRDFSAEIDLKDESTSTPKDVIVKTEDVIEDEKVVLVNNEINKPEGELPGNNDQKDKGVEQPEDINKPTKWNVEVSAGIGYANRRFNLSNQYTDLRNLAESPQVSTLFDVRAMYALSNNWNIQTGVNYMQRNEQYQAQTSTMEVSDRIVLVEETIIHPVLGEITRQVETTVLDTSWINGANITANNNFSSVNIPLALEHIFYVGNKLTILTKAGVQFGVNQSISGTSIDHNYETTDLNNLPYRATVNRVSLGVGAGYRLNNKLMLLVYPQGNVTLQPTLELSGGGIKQQEFGIYSQFGLRLSL